MVIANLPSLSRNQSNRLVKLGEVLFRQCLESLPWICVSKARQWRFVELKTDVQWRQLLLYQPMLCFKNQFIHRANDGAVQRRANCAVAAAGATKRLKMYSWTSASMNSRIELKALSRNWLSFEIPRP